MRAMVRSFFFRNSWLYNERLHIDQLQCCRDETGAQRINVSKYAFNKRDREKKKRRAQCNVAYIRHAADPVAKNATPLSHLSNSNRSFVRSPRVRIPWYRESVPNWFYEAAEITLLLPAMVDDRGNCEREGMRGMSLSWNDNRKYTVFQWPICSHV